MRALQLTLTVLLPFLLSGCLYVHTRQPVTSDMRQTPVSSYEKTGSIKVITWPLSNQGLFAWGSAAIGDVAKEQGMKEVYFADVEIFSVLRVWNEYTLHVYGK
jgi:hypothetical protein